MTSSLGDRHTVTEAEDELYPQRVASATANGSVDSFTVAVEGESTAWWTLRIP